LGIGINVTLRARQRCIDLRPAILEAGVELV
jgi:hypothetical protein